MDDESGLKQLYLSEDFGQSWRAIFTHVKAFYWGTPPYDSASTIYVEEELSDGKMQLVRTHSVNPRSDSVLLLSDLVGFEIRNEYMFATKLVRLLGPKPNLHLQLWVSYRRQNFVKAEFPGNHNFTDYFVADASEGQLMVCASINTSNTNLYVSEVTGYRFSLSLERIVYFNPKADNHDNWIKFFVNETFADITKISGVSGIYIASQQIGPMLDTENQKSFITYDKGGHWEHIKAPEYTIGNRALPCALENNCSLHLSQEFHNLLPGQQIPPILTQDSAPGLVIATGVMGTKLKGDVDVFVSSSAGIRWRQALSGIYFYATGDHGGIIVAVRQFVPTDEVVYSTDEGETWYSQKIVDERIRVYGLLTEPGENTTIFSVYGSQTLHHSWIIIQVDFLSVLGPKCTPADYKMWSVNDDLPNGCLLGRVTQYQRRNMHTLCYNGEDFVRAVEVSNCTCTKEDFECDFGYVETHNGSVCEREEGMAESDIHPVPNPCLPGMTYSFSRGYRKVTGDSCEGGLEHMYSPLQYSCPIEERSEFLLLTQYDQVWLIDLSSGEKVMLFEEGLKSVPALFDYAKNCVMYVVPGYVIKKKCFGADVITQVRSEVTVLRRQDDDKVVTSMAFDWTGRNIYYTDSASSAIRVVNVDKLFTRQLYTTTEGVRKPQAIVVDPYHGYMFFVGADSSAGTAYCIYRASMDGLGGAVAMVANSTLVASTTVMTLDLETERLYWVTPMTNALYTSDFMGLHVAKLYSGSFSMVGVTGLGMFKNFIYLASNDRHSVLMANKHAPSYWTRFTEVSYTYGMSVISNTSQHAVGACSDYHNPCSQLCMPRPTVQTGHVQNRTCLCGDGYRRNVSTTTKDEMCYCDSGEILLKDGTCERQNGSTCAPDKLSCTNGQCVNLHWKCDGDDDCGDGTDERDCPYRTCGPNTFTCRTGKCIPINWKCDREDDCRDGFASDERNCSSQSCTADQFKCDNGYCISARWRCDMDDDCHDNSDEKGCESTNSSCPSWDFTCASDGACIDIAYKCNGNNDCSDGSDEANCQGAASNCSGDYQFDCGDGMCIYHSWRCDGEADCKSGIDEQNCETTTSPRVTTEITCGYGYSRCANGYCIGFEDMCNGVDDCGDGSDESGCDFQFTTVSTTTRPCYDSEFQCRRDKACIPQYQHCDRHEDCSDGSDEENCANSCGVDQYQCQATSFTTNTRGKCIWRSFLCDGYKDCPEGDDEKDCPSGRGNTCSSTEFTCMKDGGCIPLSKLCDQSVDCMDQTDEIDCHYGTSVNCSNFDNHLEACCHASACSVYTKPIDNLFGYGNPWAVGKCRSVSTADQFRGQNQCWGQVSGSYTCGKGQFKCKNAGEFCVSDVQVCDRVKDCSNGRDEQFCDDCLGKSQAPEPSLVQVTNKSIEWNMFLTHVVVSYAEREVGKPLANLTWRNIPVSSNKYRITLDGLTPNTPYLVVFSQTVNNKSCPYARKEVTTAEGLPSAPKNLKVRVRIENYGSEVTYGVDIMWEEPDVTRGNLIEFVIYYQQVDEVGKSQSDVYTLPQWTQSMVENSDKSYKTVVVDHIEAEKTYQFWITALTKAGEGQPSDKVNISIYATPTTDLRVQLDNLMETSFKLTWKKDEGAEGYRVTVHFPEAGIDDQVIELNSTSSSCVVTGMCPGTNVEVGVQAKYKNNNYGLVWKLQDGYGNIVLNGTQPKAVLTNVTTTGPTSVFLKYTLTQGLAKYYYIYYTHDLSKTPISHTAQEIAHEINGLLACEKYFVWIRPSFPTCQSSNMKTFITEENDLAPPKDLAAVVMRQNDNYIVTLTWEAPCRQQSHAMKYIITKQEDGGPKEHVMTKFLSPKTGLSQDFPSVKDGVKVSFTVRSYLAGAQDSSPLTVNIPSMDRPYNLRVIHTGGTNVTVRWEWPQATNQQSAFKEYIVTTTGENSFVWKNHTAETVLNLNLPQDGTFVFQVTAMSTSDVVLAESTPEMFSFVKGTGNVQPDSITISKINLFAILVPVAVVVVALSAGLVFFIVRHKRLQRSFLAFANSHYNIQSGTTTFSDDLDGDEPMIQGFSDDEPLVIA